MRFKMWRALKDADHVMVAPKTAMTEAQIRGWLAGSAAPYLYQVAPLDQNDCIELPSVSGDAFLDNAERTFACAA